MLHQYRYSTITKQTQYALKYKIKITNNLNIFKTNLCKVSQFSVYFVYLLAADVTSKL